MPSDEDGLMAALGDPKVAGSTTSCNYLEKNVQCILCSLLSFRRCMHLTVEVGGWDRPAETPTTSTSLLRRRKEGVSRARIMPLKTTRIRRIWVRPSSGTTTPSSRDRDATTRSRSRERPLESPL